MTGLLATADFGFSLSLPIVVLGVVTGLTYGTLAAGLVLIYRTNKIINFAHGAIGVFGASILGLIVVQFGVPYWAAFPVGIALSAGAGALVEVAVVRRLRSAPKVLTVIATLGAGQVLLFVQALVNNQTQIGFLYPQPPGMPTFRVGALLVTPAYSAMLILTPLVVIALTVFIRFSRYGIALRASADNQDAARLAGISAFRMSTLAWMLAGGLSAFTAILIFPAEGFISPVVAGPSILLRGLVPAVIARMSNIPLALASGVAVGVIEAGLRNGSSRGGAVEAALFGLILIALLLQPRQTGRLEEKGSWAATQAFTPVPEVWRKVWVVRNAGRLGLVAALAVALVLPFLISFGSAFVFSVIFAFAVVALSIGIITGLSGELSLGQFAFAAIGATASVLIAARTGNYVLAFAGAGLVGALAATVVGVPALRIRGLFLAITTLGFGLMTQSWLLQLPGLIGSGLAVNRPIIGRFTFENSKEYYYLGLAVLVVALYLAGNVRSGGLGRILIALRDNEDAARAMSVRTWARKLQAFAIAGFIAGCAGAVYGHALARLTIETFPNSLNLDAVAAALIGGISTTAGPLVGALYIRGGANFISEGDFGALAGSTVGWLLLLLYFPGGLAAVLRSVRDWTFRRLAGPVDETGDDSAEPGNEASLWKLAGSRLVTSGLGKPNVAGVLLRADGLTKRFGGVEAVADVSLEISPGEIVGLIGPNGAGKTTLFELLAGFIRPDRGRIVFDSRLVAREVEFGPMRREWQRSPESRARAGLVRSFQDAALFPTMTAEESVMLAMERSERTSTWSTLIGLRAPERRKQVRARELINVMGLDRYRLTPIRELSTGTRRIVELACIVALEPRLVLLDEPSSGIAQRETEALGRLLVRFKEELPTTMVVIEHDIPMISSIATRMLAMEAGRIIAEGTPAEIRHDPRVVDSYLGRNVLAIERSDAPTAARLGALA